MWRKEKKNSIEKGINAKSGELLIGVIKIMMLIIENNLHVEGYYYLLSYAISVFLMIQQVLSYTIGNILPW